MPQFCSECARLLGHYASAVRATQAAVNASLSAAKAGLMADAGLIENVDFLLADSELKHALAVMDEVQRAYSRHRAEHQQ